MTDELPEWVRKGREAKALAGLKHVPGQPMTRCPVCGNKGPYCTCPPKTEVDDEELDYALLDDFDLNN